MKILVIPDVHLKPWMFNAADEIDKNKYDRIVCLGDLVDDWDQQFNTDLYDRTMQRVLKFDKNHPDMLWCLGNHDFSYLWYLPESGFSSLAAPLVERYLDKMRHQMGDRLAIIHKIDDVLFSHAGLIRTFADSVEGDNLDAVIRTINNMAYTSDGMTRLWEDDSPIWVREAGYMLGNYKNTWQVVGHTPVHEPKYIENFLITDTFSTYSDGKTPIGDGKFIIFDTDTHTWEYARM